MQLIMAVEQQTIPPTNPLRLKKLKPKRTAALMKLENQEGEPTEGREKN